MTLPADSLHPISSPQGVSYSSDVRTDANPIWSLPISGKEFEGMVVFDGDLMITICEYTQLVAVDLASGEIVWQRTDPMVEGVAKSNISLARTRDIHAAHGKLYLANGSVTLDAQTGETIPTDPFPVEYFQPVVGEWRRDNRDRQWVHVETGRTVDCPPDQPHLLQLPFDVDIFSHKLTSAEALAGYILNWSSDDRSDPERRLRCIDLASGTCRWEVSAPIVTDTYGKNVQVYQRWPMRHYLVVSEGPVTWFSGVFVVLDARDGQELWRGRSEQGGSPQRVWTGGLAHPPHDATDLLITEELRETSVAGQLRVVAAYEPITGKEVWSTQSTLTSPREAKLGDAAAGARLLARAGNILWLKHVTYRDVPRVRDGETLMNVKVAATLVAVDHNSGEVLGERKTVPTATCVGQHRGHLILREGRKLVCYA